MRSCPARLIEKELVVRGRREIGPIQNVERLKTKLSVETFRNSPDVVVLEHGNIKCPQPRSWDDIATRVPSSQPIATLEKNWRCRDEALELNVVVHATRINQRLAARPCQTVWIADWVGVPLPNGIPRYKRRHRLTGLNGKNAPCLPASRHRPHK